MENLKTNIQCDMRSKDRKDTKEKSLKKDNNYLNKVRDFNHVHMLVASGWII